METPRIIEAAHIEARILFRSSGLKEGVIQELSPSKASVRISGKWYENSAGLVVEILPEFPKVAGSSKPTRHKVQL